MYNNSGRHKLKINYPCEWEYRIIGTNEESLKLAVSEILGNKKYVLSFSNISKTGKYISLSLSAFVENEDTRNRIYISLRKHTAVKSVL